MTAPGWYADPLARAELRWYDGAGWGEHVRSGSTTGSDPLDPEGVPLALDPAWDPEPLLPTGPAPGPAHPRGSGRGTTLALIAVVVVFVLLGMIGIGALLVMVRNTGTLTTSDIEGQVGQALGQQRDSVMTVSCPPVIYLGDAGGTVECTADDVQSGAQLRVQVTIKRAKVTGWTVMDSTEPGGLPGEPDGLPATGAVGVPVT